jgi:uncharacterized SAM-binding protein YcdF (DUF218 family)
LRKADAILGLGSNDPRVAERSADLYLEGLAPLIVFSGDVSPTTAGLYGISEAARFAEIAEERGVPPESILTEGRSTNTGENALFIKALLESKEIAIHNAIVVQKPYMERRSYATFKKRWPGLKISVTSPRIPYSEYPLPWLSKDDVINIIVGDLQRIRLYPEKGFQIPQEIPDDVWAAFEQLVAMGYVKHLAQDGG